MILRKIRNISRYLVDLLTGKTTQNIYDRLGKIDERIRVIDGRIIDHDNRITDHDNRIANQVSFARKLLLKSEALSKPEKIPQPCAVDTGSIVEDYSVGYSGNLLNNAYTFCKILRKNGRNAQLFLDPKFSDNMVTSLPDWEEVDFNSSHMPRSIDELPLWDRPDFIKSAEWNLDHLNHLSLEFTYEKMVDFFHDTPVEVIPNDELSYLIAYSAVPHRDLLRLYDSVDILHVSGVHIGVASYTNKPYVTFPFGGDLFSLPFNNDEIGWLQARGFRRANRHIISGNIMFDYMKTLGIPEEKIDVIPLMIDTDVNSPVSDNPIREELNRKYPGKVIFFLGARQNWFWKGNDKFLKAVTKVKDKIENAVFLTVWYGQDTERSDELIQSLGIDHVICKMGIFSKKALRNYIDAADVCIDQFTHGGLGTFALESMSCAKPLITYYTSDKHFHFDQDPPVINSFSEDEIAESIVFCSENSDKLAQTGHNSREWIKRYHGHEALWPAYDEVYRKALADSRNRF